MAQMRNLTDRLIASLQPEDKEYQIIDTRLRGFAVRVLPSGGKSYVIWQPRDGGSPGRKSLGSVENMNCEGARRQASRLLLDETRPVPVAPLLEDFVRDVWVPNHNRRIKPATIQSRSQALRDILPTFGDQKMDCISRTEIVRWFDQLSGEGLVKANRALNTLAAVYSFANERGVVDITPTRGIRRNRIMMRTRFLSQAEIDHLIKTMSCDAEENPQSDHAQYRDIVTLLLLTGCRKGEIVNLRWQEVEEDRLRLVDSKTGPRPVWLNAEARAILARQPKQKSVYVFPSLNDSEKPCGGLNHYWGLIRQRAGLDDVRLHDLRHTFASHAIIQGVPLPTLSRLLGHSRISMTMRYTHVSNARVEAAAEQLGVFLDNCLSGDRGETSHASAGSGRERNKRTPGKEKTP